MVLLNVKTVVMRRTVPCAQPSSSCVIKEAVLMLRGAATVNPTVLMTLMSKTVKVGLHLKLEMLRSAFLGPITNYRSPKS